MALRLLPFRQYAEQDVVNLYSNVDCNSNTNVRGNGDAGVFVSVVSGDLNQGPIMYDNNVSSDISWNTAGIPHLGRDGYPIVPLKVQAAAVAAKPKQVLGITLYQTALRDENGEKLLYYPQKKLETQSVLSGEAVPVLTRGVITVALSTGTLNGNSVTNNPVGWTPGRAFKASTQQPGKVESCAVSDGDALGSILATGMRTAVNTADQFAGNPGGTGRYAIVRLSN